MLLWPTGLSLFFNWNTLVMELLSITRDQNKNCSLLYLVQSSQYITSVYQRTSHNIRFVSCTCDSENELRTINCYLRQRFQEAGVTEAIEARTIKWASSVLIPVLVYPAKPIRSVCKTLTVSCDGIGNVSVQRSICDRSQNCQSHFITAFTTVYFPGRLHVARLCR